MRGVLCFASVLMLAGPLPPVLGQFSNSGVPGAQQGGVHAPWSKDYLPLLPGQPIRYGRSQSWHLGHGGHGHHHLYHGGYGWPAWDYVWWGPYGYPSYYPYPGPIVLPPTFAPAEGLFGPQSVQRFMGADAIAPQPQRPVIVEQDDGGVPVGNRIKVRASNAEMRARAGRFMARGDASFASQNYNSAAERYREATRVAPDMADTYLRQGIALAAMGRYESAVKVVRRALLLQPQPSDWDFHLSDLYQENVAARMATIESLAAEIERDPQSADLLLLLGLHLYFDGDVERALPLLVRCDQLGGNQDGAISEFLKPSDEVLGKEI